MLPPEAKSGYKVSNKFCKIRLLVDIFFEKNVLCKEIYLYLCCMIIIRNRYIPFGRYTAVNLFGVVFAKQELSRVVRNHEFIHTLQQRELLFVGFYVLYVFEFLVRLALCRNPHEAYQRISFEREAYAHMHNLDYPHHRPLWSWRLFF